MGDSAGWGGKVVSGHSSDSMQGAAGRRLHPSAVTAVRSCGKAAGARARSSLDLGPVVPGALRADWPTGPEDVGRVRRADHGADFGGRFRQSGPFQFFSPGWIGRSLPNPAALQARCSFWKTPQNGGAGGGGGAMAGARGARGLRPGTETGPLPVPGLSCLSGNLRGWLGPPCGTGGLGRWSRRPCGRRWLGPLAASQAVQSSGA